MGKGPVFLAGLLAGAALAHVVSRTPAGARAFAAVNRAGDGLVAAVSGSSRPRRSESR